MENRNTEIDYNCRHLQYFIFIWENAKKYAFWDGQPNTDTAYRCRQFPYLNFKYYKNAKFHVFSNEKTEYRNSIEMYTVSVLVF